MSHVFSEHMVYQAPGIMRDSSVLSGVNLLHWIKFINGFITLNYIWFKHFPYVTIYVSHNNDIRAKRIHKS